MKNKIWKILSLVAMFLFLVACGNGNTGDSSESEVEETAPATEEVANRDDVEVNDDTIHSTGPNGEEAVNANEIELTEEEKDKIREGNYTAAISFHYHGNDFSASQEQGLRDTFEDLGIELITITDANFSVEQQVSDIENIISLDPDILISLPVNPVSTEDTYRRASEAGIGIVFMDNLPNGLSHGEEYISVVSADNYGNGVIAADLLGEALNGEGQVGTIFHDEDYFVTNQRYEAFLTTMKEKYPNIEIVTEQGFTDENMGSELADIILTQYPTIDGIFAHWDILAEGALSSINAVGADVALTTIDLGNTAALEIAKGNIVGLGAQMPYDQGVAEATLAGYYLLGKETPPYVAVPAKRVDQSNILEAYEDVYKVETPDWLKDAYNENN